MISRLILLCVIALFATPQARAALLGFDSFTYSNGLLNDQTGGTAWNRVGGVSDWDATASILNGKLVTTNTTTASREFGGDESGSAVQATGQVFFRFTLTYGSVVPERALLSSFEFGNEIIRFGRFTNSYGIEVVGVGSTGFGSNAQANSTVTMIAAIDFANDRLALFVNPDANDFYDSETGTADVQRIYTASNWSTHIGFSSDSSLGGSATWDDVTVATTFAEVVPEPGSAALLIVGFSLLTLSRRTQRLTLKGAAEARHEPSGCTHG